jgi:ribosomal protein S18 acetylase RimI-like enzyme
MPGEARRGLAPGRAFTVIEVDGMRLAPVICADVLHPGTFEEVGRLRPDLIVSPVTSPFRPEDTRDTRDARDVGIFLRGAQEARAAIVKVGSPGSLFGRPLQGRCLVATPEAILFRTPLEEEQETRAWLVDVPLAPTAAPRAAPPPDEPFPPPPAVQGSMTTPSAAPLIRPAAATDDEALWRILEPIVRAGDVFAVNPALSREEALRFWRAPGHEVHVAQVGTDVPGTYFLKANQSGGGAHVANCGYATRPDARGRGVARALCAHSLARARERGFRAMQFNFVISRNERAVRLWESFGFDTVGRLPGAFLHPTEGYVDVLVMYRTL